MTVETVSSTYAHQNWGYLIMNAVEGIRTIIERYNRPAAVLISHEEYKHFLSLQSTLLAESRRIAEKNDSEGTWVSGEEVERKLRQRGILVD